jgi:threonine/homoserine/homoserine lactone efflux protein
MFGTHDFVVFLAAGISLNLMPGPDTMYILGRSVSQGRNSGYLSALGIGTGCLVHTTAAAFGLSAVLLASTVAFSVVKLAGATYLVYLGLQMLLRKKAVATDGFLELPGADLRTVYKQALLTNVLNPKVAVFFIAFLPQFVIPASAASPAPYIFLGCVFVCTGTLWCLVIATVAGNASKTLRARAGALQTVNRIVGAVFVGLGVRLALQNAR